jgi:hypothetical protein
MNSPMFNENYDFYYRMKIYNWFCCIVNLISLQKFLVVLPI